MNVEKLREIISLYRSYFEKRGIAKKEFSNLQYQYYIVGDDLLAQCHWMLGKMEEFTNQGQSGLEKAFRWLGFIQGCLASQQCFTIKQLREQSRS